MKDHFSVRDSKDWEFTTEGGDFTIDGPVFISKNARWTKNFCPPCIGMSEYEVRQKLYGPKGVGFRFNNGRVPCQKKKARR